jgi:hypothetical protein
MTARSITTRGRIGVALGALALLVTLACVGRWSADVPVQGWWGERGPVVPHDAFPADCSLCHAGDGWTEIRSDFTWDHALETGVALVGAHAEAQCLRCHNDRGPVALFAARGCAGCHEDAHRGTMGGDCQTCHDQETWRPDEVIEIHARTRFPLIGAHAAAACWRCHPGSQVGNFSPVSAECITCHQSDLALALDPDHLAQGWVDDCGDCHVPTTWEGAGFTHAQWPLTGAHKAADCTACHTGGTFAGTPNQCFDCHMDDYFGVTDPDHDVLGFSTACADCHDTGGWEGAQFDHAGIVTDCADCHLADYQGTTDPNHVLEGYPTSCEQCHDTKSWEGAVFDHTGIVTNCADCHLDDYQATTDPDHVAQGFPTSCEDCHATDTWLGAIFEHGGITSGCADCHLDDYLGTSDPNHQTAGFPTECEACHFSFTTWDGAVFDHTFKITSGDHANLDCADCHERPGSYSAPSCIHCHEHSFEETADEHDDVSGFVYASAACIECHPTGDE